MAIKVNGTTVINDSRALSNIASVDATTAAAIGAAGVGGGGTVDLVADGSITAGDAVGINSDGKAQVATGLTGADYVFTTSTTNSYRSSISGMSSTKAVVVYVDNSGNIKGKVVTISPTSLSYGSEFTISNSQSPGYLYSVYEPNSDKVLVTWRNDGTGQYYLKAVVVSVSGTTGSIGSIVTVSTNPNYDYQLLPRPGSNPHVLLAWRGNSPGSPGNLKLLTISGTSISQGSLRTSGDAFRRAAWISSTRVWKLSGNYGRYASYNDLSGTSFGAQQNNTDIYTGGWDRTEFWWDSLNSRLVRVVADAGGFRMEAYTATSSISLTGTTVLTAPGEVFGGSIQAAYYSTQLNRGIFQYRAGGTSADPHYLQKITIENNAPVVETSIPLDERARSWSNAGGNVLFTTYGESPDPTNGRASFVNFGSTLFSFIGFASNSVSSGQTVTVDIVGGTNTSQSGLTTGSYYGIKNDGTLAPGVAGPVGVATSATSILIQTGRDA